MEHRHKLDAEDAILFIQSATRHRAGGIPIGLVGYLKKSLATRVLAGSLIEFFEMEVIADLIVAFARFSKIVSFVSRDCGRVKITPTFYDVCLH
jgi:hypothetical protein